jgi:hypothetical protein
LSGKYRGCLSDAYSRGFVLPAQTALLLFPVYSHLASGEFSDMRLILIGKYFAYLLLIWLCMCLFLLALRTSGRKFLFGRIPAILAGIPFIILIVGICLIIAAGFASISVNGILNIVYRGG